jgi:intracellular septation protein
MNDLLHAGRLLVLDLAPTLFFLVVLLATKDVSVAVASGIVLGVGQIAWQIVRNKPIDVMQWMSLVAVIGSGVATLISHDPRFVMAKPSAIYVVVGALMLKRGWMNRYLPSSTKEILPEIAVGFGFAWACLMFASAALNLVVALTCSVATWSVSMTSYGIVSKVGLIVIQHATMHRLKRTLWNSRTKNPSISVEAA